MSEMFRPEEKIETVCRTCIFAEYKDPNDKLLQTGCLTGRLEKYKKQGIVLKEYIDDFDQKFYGIPNRVCLSYRTKSWLEKQPKEANKIEIAREEIVLRMEIIIYIDEQADFQDIGVTIDSLAKGKIKPTKVIFCDHKNIRPSTFRNWLTGRIKMGWRIEHIREAEADFYRCLDICMKKTIGRYIGIFKAGFQVPDDFISSIDKALHDDLERFLYLEPCDAMYNGMVIQNLLQKTLGGNRENPLIDKIRRKALEQECPHMIRNVTEIVPSLKSSNNCRQSLLSSLVTITKNL